MSPDTAHGCKGQDALATCCRLHQILDKQVNRPICQQSHVYMSFIHTWCINCRQDTPQQSFSPVAVSCYSCSCEAWEHRSHCAVAMLVSYEDSDMHVNSDCTWNGYMQQGMCKQSCTLMPKAGSSKTTGSKLRLRRQCSMVCEP